MDGKFEIGVPEQGLARKVLEEPEMALERFVACYRDPEGRQRSAGTYSSRRAAERAGNREEAKVRDGSWHDHSRGQVTFAEYVETVWLPSKHVETSTLAGVPVLPRQAFHLTFGRRPIGKILPSEVQRWVTTASAPDPATGDGNGLSAASVRKYHTMLHSVFERALRDRVVTFKPCAHTELPKVIKKKARTLTPDEYIAILTALPAHHRLMVETAINTGLEVGRAHRAEAPPPRPHQAHADRRKRQSWRFDQELPHRRTDAHQALPQRQRGPHPGSPGRPRRPAR